MLNDDPCNTLNCANTDVVFSCVFVCARAEDSLLRQDDLWMLDGDYPQEALPRTQRPDHLDFLRITPPDDDLMGDTPYCPKLERTVRVCLRIPHKHRPISPHSSIHVPTG